MRNESGAGSPVAATAGDDDTERRRSQGLAIATAFLALFSIVGLALYWLPFFYDFFVRDLGWTRQQVTSGNALSKLVVGPLFGFLAGTVVDRFGPRRLMLFGILIAGLAPVGLGGTATLAAFYAFYLMNALGNVCGGPLPNQVLLSGWFDAGRGRAMGIAYLGIGNESWDCGGNMTPEYYLSQLKAYSRFVRNFNPAQQQGRRLHPRPTTTDHIIPRQRFHDTGGFKI